MDKVNASTNTPESSNLEEGQASGAPFAEQQAIPEVALGSILNLGVYRGVDLGPNGLCLPDGLSFDSWRELGCRVALVANCSAWWLGDWLVYGEQAYVDRYEQAITDSSLSYQTLRNYAWVARTFPMSRRRDTLSLGHHMEVAALPNDEQDAWLARAEQLSWSCSRLRRALRAAKLANRRASGDEEMLQTTAVKIDVDAERHDRWQLAAKRKDCSMADWIIRGLDRVAREDLVNP